MSTCIFPGRFQPFHNGHLLVVQGMMKSCGRAVIVICTGGNDADKDLFTPEEVREMIGAALLSEDIVDANIVECSDSESDEEWADKILEAAGRPEEAVVWSGDEKVREIFEKMDIKTQKIVHVPGIVSAELREMLKTGDTEWRSKVPGGAMDVVWDKFKG
ncbi:MAG: adenylyltransferase/cytidyltransferase family protein [Candidatus Uhrbacteria bacterium]|nr:adenylyltransferase/cytidyltransferase family protein [Candidatus Uhrbacteria bacterium]